MQYNTTNTQDKFTNQVISTITNCNARSNSCIHELPLTRKSQLNSIILNADGTPDRLAICLYWDHFRSWYAPNKMKLYNGSVVEVSKLKTKGIYTDYAKLSELYNCSKETIRKKLVKLEKMGLIQRGFQHKETVTTKSYNKLIIYVWKDTPHFISKYGISPDEVPYIKPQTNHKYITKKYNIDYGAKTYVNQVKESRGGIHTQLDTKELIEPFNKLKDRSMKSNFIFQNFKDKEDDILEVKLLDVENVSDEKTSIKTKLSAKIRTFFATKPKPLSKFHPLSETDCSELRSSSGREFTNNAINEILLDMSKRLSDRVFKSKKGFLSYMSKALTFELRDAVKTSNENFRIKANRIYF